MDFIYKQENKTSKYYDFRPSQNWGQIDTLLINDREYKLNLTFKNVIKILNLHSSNYPYKFKVNKSFEILNLNLDIQYETKTYILDEIVKYLFNTKNQALGEKTFDFELDYKYYYYDFLKLGIDLNTRDISWWEFDNLLEGILLTDNTAIGKVLAYRTYEKPSKNPKVVEQKEDRFYQNMKRRYALPIEKSVVNGLEKLFNYVEKKAGEQNGK